MRQKILVMLVAFLLCGQAAMAADKILASVPAASVVGRGVLSYAFWDIYEATLYAPKGAWSAARPFALSIEYYKDINGRDIADTSAKEMRKQGFTNERKLSDWNAQMRSIFPDVKQGTVLSAVYIPGRHTIFYDGNRAIGSIKGDDFGRLFFGIWLSEQTSKPALRRALLGLS
jgi:hypothetical protein